VGESVSLELLVQVGMGIEAGLAIVLVTGLLYLMIARPDRHSDDVGEGDAIEVAAKLRSLRAGSGTQ